MGTGSANGAIVGSNRPEFQSETVENIDIRIEHDLVGLFESFDVAVK